jgi:ADP-ribose pyrophosphatase
VQVDEVELADGTRTTREVVSHPGAVAVVPMFEDGRVVMIRQYRHAAGRVLWELPAGTLGEGEAPEECARRELAEEVGYEAGRLRPLFSTYLSPGYSKELIHVFVARELRETSARREADERIEAVQLSLEEAIAMIGRGEVQNAAAICGLLAVARWWRGEEEAGRRD